MAATKEQERKALEKIRKIISDLGEDSYLKMAFDGCFEIAESNIENDFGDSPRENINYAESQIKNLEAKIETISDKNRTLQNRINSLEIEIISKETLQVAAEAIRKVKGDYLEEDIKLKNTIVENAETPDTEIFKNAVQRHKFLNNECEAYKKALDEIKDKI